MTKISQVYSTNFQTTILKYPAALPRGFFISILRERGIKPHPVKKFQLSADRDFADELKGAAGLYMNPPLNAVILCVDEKPRIQALERTRPVLPVLPGAPERRTVDYERHGAAALFSALEVVTGNVIGGCKAARKADDYIEFLKKAGRDREKGKAVHLIADNYSTHKNEGSERIGWLNSRPVCNPPAHFSRLNSAEGRFAEITNKRIRIRRGSRESAPQLIKAIKE
jgi:transposase